MKTTTHPHDVVHLVAVNEPHYVLVLAGLHDTDLHGQILFPVLFVDLHLLDCHLVLFHDEPEDRAEQSREGETNLLSRPHIGR